MKLVVDYPVQSGQWIDPESVIGFARTMESLGVEALGFTDHPAPSAKWLESGGHETFDPFSAMSFVAAVTTRLKVMSHLLVVPYRNPLLQASAIASVDVLSSGRTIFVLGTGYLRSEFAALGVDFDRRNALFDESVDVMRRALSGEDVAFQGHDFTAVQQRVRPLPVQRPRPPLWVGGNSARALERVACWADGWSAMVVSETMARTARTRPIASIEELGRAIVHIRRRAEAVGRDPDEIKISASSPQLATDARAPALQQLEQITRLREIGVEYVRVVVQGEYQQAVDEMHKFSELALVAET